MQHFPDILYWSRASFLSWHWALLLVAARSKCLPSIALDFNWELRATSAPSCFDLSPHRHQVSCLVSPATKLGFKPNFSFIGGYFDGGNKKDLQLFDITKRKRLRADWEQTGQTANNNWFDREQSVICCSNCNVKISSYIYLLQFNFFNVAGAKAIILSIICNYKDYSYHFYALWLHVNWSLSCS